MTVVKGWTSGDTPIVGPNVNATSFTDLGLSGGPGAATVSALAGVPGEDLLFVGASNDAGSASASGAVYRAAPSGAGSSVAFTGGTTIAGGAVSGTLVAGGVNALAYCPTDGSAATTQDVLLVATGTDTAGTVVRIAGAGGGSSTETVVLTGVPPVNDVRLHCAAPAGAARRRDR